MERSPDERSLVDTQHLRGQICSARARRFQRLAFSLVQDAHNSAQHPISGKNPVSHTASPCAQQGFDENLFTDS